MGVLVTVVTLGSSLVYSHFSTRHMAEAFVVEARVIRGAAITAMYGAGFPGKQPADDRRSLALHATLFLAGIAVFVIWLRRTVSQPIDSLSAAMVQARRESDLSLNVPYGRNDEIGRAASPSSPTR